MNLAGQIVSGISWAICFVIILCFAAWLVGR